jgi:hypothetical protein
MYAYVEDAGKQIPDLLAILHDGLRITPQVAEHYLPPFDEVFVRIIQASEAMQAGEIAQ